MIVVEIQDTEDGRVSFEIGPFEDRSKAEAWREWFLSKVTYDGDFVEIHDITHKVYDPGSDGDMKEILDFYADAEQNAAEEQHQATYVRGQ